MTTIGFLHTSPVHVPTFDGLTHQTWPLLGTIHVVDESILTQARADGPEMTQSAVRAHLNELKDSGADAVCCTCSTIGDIAEKAGIGLPVFRVDRPMARRAVEMGPRVGVVAALESTLAPTSDLIAQEAVAMDSEISIELMVAGHAWSLFEAGDMDGYIRAISESSLALAGRVDVIVLAQQVWHPPRSNSLAFGACPVESTTGCRTRCRNVFLASVLMSGSGDIKREMDGSAVFTGMIGHPEDHPKDCEHFQFVLGTDQVADLTAHLSSPQ